MFFEAQYWSFRALVKVPSPCNCSSNGRIVFVQIRTVFESDEQLFDGVQLAHVLLQNIFISIRDLLLDGTACHRNCCRGTASTLRTATNLLEVFHQFKCALRRSKLTKALLNEQLCHFLDFSHIRTKTFHDCIPRFLIGFLEYLFFERHFERHCQIVDTLDDFVNPCRVSSNCLQFRTEKHSKVVQCINNFKNVCTYFTHVISFEK
mmetsp:Transcript_13859/g.18769  ORF Transcript_13859/g.18769 Transcript_13859/m.18769 type:complete len:206 (-) Transcript_13859:1565-2182(-)